LRQAPDRSRTGGKERWVSGAPTLPGNAKTAQKTYGGSPQTPERWAWVAADRKEGGDRQEVQATVVRRPGTPANESASPMGSYQGSKERQPQNQEVQGLQNGQPDQVVGGKIGSTGSLGRKRLWVLTDTNGGAMGQARHLDEKRGGGPMNRGGGGNTGGSVGEKANGSTNKKTAVKVLVAGL